MTNDKEGLAAPLSFVICALSFPLVTAGRKRSTLPAPRLCPSRHCAARETRRSERTVYVAPGQRGRQQRSRCRQHRTAAGIEQLSALSIGTAPASASNRCLCRLATECRKAEKPKRYCSWFSQTLHFALEKMRPACKPSAWPERNEETDVARRQHDE